MKDQFTVKISVKPYIRKYLQNNCGEPVDLTNLPALNEFFISLLSKPSKRYESKINNKFYTDEIEILISKDNFNRFGYELTKTDTVRFNSRIESLIKFASRLFIANNNSLGISITQSIKEFQDMFGFTDDDFQYDTIKKDFDRHGMKFETRILVAFKQELKKIFLENLSEIGTVSQNFKNEKIIQQYE